MADDFFLGRPNLMVGSLRSELADPPSSVLSSSSSPLILIGSSKSVNGRRRREAGSTPAARCIPDLETFAPSFNKRLLAYSRA